MKSPLLKRAFASLALALLATTAPAAESPSEWAWVQSFRSPVAGAVRIALPISLLDVAREDLADLRLLDAAGQSVAFVVERPAPGELRAPKSFRVTVEKEATVALLETGAIQPIGGVLLDSPNRAFLKAVTVEGSPDAKTWKVLEERRPVFRHPSGEARPEIAFEPGAWRWLRVTLDDHRSPPDSAHGGLAPRRPRGRATRGAGARRDLGPRRGGGSDPPRPAPACGQPCPHRDRPRNPRECVQPGTRSRGAPLRGG